MADTLQPSSRFDLSQWEKVIQYISERKKVLKMWRSHPPHSIGICVLMGVCLEIQLAKRVFFDMGPGPSIFGDFFGILIFIFAAQLFVGYTGHRVAYIFNKRGKFSTVLTFFNLDLLPLLLYLPATLLIMAGNNSGGLRFLILLLLVFKVFTNWKDSLEINYSLTRWQSALIMGGLSLTLYLLLPTITMMAFYGSIQDLVELFSN